MIITYTEKTNELGWKYIEMLDSEKPDSITVIPTDPTNSDYQAYLGTLVADSDNANSN